MCRVGRINPPHIAPATADFLGKLDHDVEALCGDPWANCLAATDNMSTEKIHLYSAISVPIVARLGCSVNSTPIRDPFRQQIRAG